MRGGPAMTRALGVAGARGGVATGTPGGSVMTWAGGRAVHCRAALGAGGGQEGGGHRGARGERAAAAPPREGYGLVDAHVPEYVRREGRDDTALTKRAMEESATARAAEAAAEAERAAAARRRYRPGALSAEEKEARLLEMASNAAQVGAQRMHLLRKEHDADAQQAAQEVRACSQTWPFCWTSCLSWCMLAAWAGALRGFLRAKGCLCDSLEQCC